MSDLWNGSYYRQYSKAQEAIALDLLKTFSFRGNERILDIGCGPGNISKWIADRVPAGEVVGIDPSRDMLGQALNDYKDVAHLSFYEQQAETFRFDRPFDVIVSFHALHFVKARKKAFERIREALAPGGRILLHMGSKQNAIVSEVFERPHWKEVFSFEDRVFFTSEGQAKELFKDLGFHCVEIKSFSKVYEVESAPKLIELFMTWLPYVTKLGKDKTLRLAQETTEHLCSYYRCSENIPLEFNPLVITASLANS